MEQQWFRVHDRPEDQEAVLAIEDMERTADKEAEAHIQDDQTPPERKVPMRPEMTRAEQRQFRVEPTPAPWTRQENPHGILTVDGRWHAEGLRKREEDIFYDPEYHREEKRLQDLKKKHGDKQCKYQWTPSGCRNGARCPFCDRVG